VLQPRSKPLIAKAAQKKRRKKLIFGDQVPVRPERDTRPQRLRKKEAAAAGPVSLQCAWGGADWSVQVTVVLVGGLPWEVLDQQLKDKIDKTGKVLNGGIVKCQVRSQQELAATGAGCSYYHSSSRSTVAVIAVVTAVAVAATVAVLAVVSASHYSWFSSRRSWSDSRSSLSAP